MDNQKLEQLTSKQATW